MRGMLERADLDRYAGQFVWLELNFDKAENRAFFTKYGAISTPTFYVIDPRDQKVTASQAGAMSLAELKQFMDRGARGMLAKTQTPADQALARGDALMAKQPAEAVKAYRESIHLAAPNWARQELAEASLVTALQNSGQYEECAKTAATEAPGMKRDAMFGRTVMTGMWCVVTPDPAPWVQETGGKLEPLAREALSLPVTVRDHRDELYRTLMYLSLSRNDKAAAARWGDLWLAELDAVKPANDEERSATDIARVEEVQTYGDPKRILPALLASERAMPHSWNASLRVAQMEDAAQDYHQAIAACDRGLERVPGPAGRSWLLRIKAGALTKLHRTPEARTALREALKAAHAIPNESTRNNNVETISRSLEQLEKPGTEGKQ